MTEVMFVVVIYVDHFLFWIIINSAQCLVYWKSRQNKLWNTFYIFHSSDILLGKEFSQLLIWHFSSRGCSNDLPLHGSRAHCLTNRTAEFVRLRKYLSGRVVFKTEGEKVNIFASVRSAALAVINKKPVCCLINVRAFIIVCLGL